MLKGIIRMKIFRREHDILDCVLIFFTIDVISTELVVSLFSHEAPNDIRHAYLILIKSVPFCLLSV